YTPPPRGRPLRAPGRDYRRAGPPDGPEPTAGGIAPWAWSGLPEDAGLLVQRQARELPKRHPRHVAPRRLRLRAQKPRLLGRGEARELLGKHPQRRDPLARWAIVFGEGRHRRLRLPQPGLKAEAHARTLPRGAPFACAANSSSTRLSRSSWSED